MRKGWMVACLAGTLACKPDPSAGMPWVAYFYGPTAPDTCPAAQGFDAAPLFAISKYGTDCLVDGGCDASGPEEDCLASAQCEDDLLTPAVPNAFERSPDDAPIDGLPDALARFCLYVPEDGNTGSSTPKLEQDEGWRVQRSQRVVAPHAASVDGELRAYYAAATAEQSSLCASTRPRTAPVRLTFLDSAPTGSIETLKLPVSTPGHGEALALGIHELVCADDPECLLDVRLRAALPLQHDATLATRWTVPQGGTYGSLDWVAQSIVREVTAWKLWSPNSHLVLNLSLGWHPNFGGGVGPFETSCPKGNIQGNGEPPPECIDRTDVHAVYEAIRYARCEGALVFAAAGNRLGGGLDDGPLYPAAWQAGVVGDCSKDFGIVNPEVRGAPVLYAVGAVSADNEPLAVSRDKAEPAMVAYGRAFDSKAAHAAQLSPLTGTSAASAIVAAAAADLWSERADLTADRIAETLHLSGRDLGRLPATAYGELLARNVHRVGGVCVNDPARPPDLDRADEDKVISDAALPVPLNLILPTKPSIAYDPFAHPQPTGTFCPICAVDLSPIGGGAMLYVDLPLFPGTVTDARLATFTGVGTWSQISLGSLTSPSELAITGIPGTPIRAILLFRSGSETYFSEITVL